MRRAKSTAVSDRFHFFLRVLLVVVLAPLIVAARPHRMVLPKATQSASIAPESQAQKITSVTTGSRGVVAVVNDAVISDYDLNQRLALFVATSGVHPGTRPPAGTTRRGRRPVSPGPGRPGSPGNNAGTCPRYWNGPVLPGQGRRVRGRPGAGDRHVRGRRSSAATRSRWLPASRRRDLPPAGSGVPEYLPGPATCSP